MPKLGEMLGETQTEALEALKPSLPARRLREEHDPVGVAVDSLMALLGACLAHERRLPRPVRDQLKRTIAAAGRAGLTNRFGRAP